MILFYEHLHKKETSTGPWFEKQIKQQTPDYSSSLILTESML